MTFQCRLFYYARLLFFPLLFSLGGASFAMDDIPPGTKITRENWEQYKDFMPLGMQELFKGTYHWKLPDDVVMEVGKVTPIPPRRKYKENTEKYGGQVTLKPFEETGGYVPEGYVAGLPFPDPQEPLKAVKIMYNAYYRDYPRLIHWLLDIQLQDRFGNRTVTKGDLAYYRLSGMSEEGMPEVDPQANGRFLSQYVTMTAPEQSKYITQLTLIPHNPAKEADQYAFIPSLRRSLRLAASATCAPIIGTDWTPDDVNGFNGIPAFFVPELVAEKKILMMVNVDPGQLKRDGPGFWDPPTWPKPVAGKWEARDAYVINIKRAQAVAAGYCYASRLAYVDKETWSNMWVDAYDNSNKLWKIIVHFSAIYKFRNGEQMLPMEGNAVSVGFDVQNDHFTNTFEAPVSLNEDVPQQYQNLQRYAHPSALNEVMR